jgi:chorismate dehydratase
MFINDGAARRAGMIALMKVVKLLGAVSFLNARPLVAPLKQGSIRHNFRIVSDVPSRCADRLLAGEMDVALIPSVEYAQHPDDYEIIPEVCIASDGRVASVLLFSKVPVAAIRTLAIDARSRASAVLARILLHERYHISPEFVVTDPHADLMLSLADAGLLIGDTALDQDWRPDVVVLDLGMLWKELTELPFVYAFWVCRRGRLTPEEAHALIAAKEVGRTLFRKIAVEHAKVHPKSPIFYESYLRGNVCYDMGRREIEGLLTFYRFAHRLGLIERVPELRFSFTEENSEGSVP